MHYIYMEELYMIKGHVAIELRNHKTGLRDRIEGDNMITNALNYAIPFTMGANYSADSIMPLCKRALGGLMLFDGTLTEDKNNMFFPTEAHLVASAGRGLNTTNTDRGSLNSAETYQTDTGYQSVWDFSTSQANGTIKSLALTLNYSGGSIYYADTPYSFSAPFTRIGAANDSGSVRLDMGYPLCYDTENQYLYFISKLVGGVTSRKEQDESGNNVYKYSCDCHVMKTYYPTTKFKLADTSNAKNSAIEVCTFTEETGTSSVDTRQYWKPGYDGYAYRLETWETGKICAHRLKLSDYSFEMLEDINATCKSVSFDHDYSHNVVSKGYAYIINSSNQSLYIVNLSNAVDVSEVTLPSGWKMTNELTALKNGGVEGAAYKGISGTSSTDYRPFICYPDGKIVMSDTTKTSISYYPEFAPPRLITDNLMSIGTSAYDGYQLYGRLLNNYLGTIYNLPQPIVKTAASSMKVVYTLTDID